MSDVRISIKMPMYLKQYIVGIYKQEPVPASNKNFIGLYLNPLLIKTPKNYIPKRIHESEKNNYLEIKILQCYRDRDNNYWNYISIDNERHFVEVIRMQLYHEFVIYYMKEKYKYPLLQTKQIIFNFCELKNIHDLDKAYEVMKKKLSRFKINIINNMKHKTFNNHIKNFIEMPGRCSPDEKSKTKNVLKRKLCTKNEF